MFVRLAVALLITFLLVMAAACVPGESPAAAEPPPDAAEATDPNAVLENREGEPATAASESEADDTALPGQSPKSMPGNIWAETVVEGNRVTISREVAAMEDHVHFEVPANGGTVGFLGYFIDGRFYAQAMFCPNCGANTLEWAEDALACGKCGATFELISGKGRDGALDYPSGRISHAIAGNTITMPLDDLIEAYSRTASGEETLFEVVTISGGGGGCCRGCG